jgi:hypothetical protein
MKSVYKLNMNNRGGIRYTNEEILLDREARKQGGSRRALGHISVRKHPCMMNAYPIQDSIFRAQPKCKNSNSEHVASNTSIDHVLEREPSQVSNRIRIAQVTGNC